MSEIIRLEEVWKIYGKPPSETAALGGVSLTVNKGEFFAIVGPSGSGKTTMLHLIGGLDRPTRGKIYVDGTELTAIRSDSELSRYRNKTVGFVFQLFYLIPRLNVLENVELPLVKRGVPKAERRRLALEALRTVGIEMLAYKYPTQLSGGEQQRVAIARAIVGSPRVLLADEPTGNLDAANSQIVMDLFKRLNRELGMTIIMVTHNLELIWNCDRVARMHSGKLLGIYTPEKYSELIASFVKKGQQET
jgi:putative ABC transport system ATP-binding protein